MILGALNSWSAICAIVFFVGFGLGGNIPIDATIVLEFLPNVQSHPFSLSFPHRLLTRRVGPPIPPRSPLHLPTHRYVPSSSFPLSSLNQSQPGVIITSLISWALIPNFACPPGLPSCSPSSQSSSNTCCTKSSNYGWRYTLFTLGGLSVLAFIGRFVLFTFHESPVFLVGKGRDREAVEVVYAIARFNGAEVRGDVGGEMGAVDARFGGGGDDGGGDGKGGDEREEDVGREEAGKGERERWRGVGHLKVLFGSSAMVRLTVLTWVCYAADYWYVLTLLSSRRYVFCFSLRRRHANNAESLTGASSSQATSSPSSSPTAVQRTTSPPTTPTATSTSPPSSLPLISFYLWVCLQHRHRRRRRPRRPPRHRTHRGAPHRPKVGDGLLERAHGRQSLPLRNSNNTRRQRRVQRDGVLLPVDL